MAMEIKSSMTNGMAGGFGASLWQRKAKQSNKSPMDDLLGGNRANSRRAAKTGTGMSSASMQALIAADVTMSQVSAQSSVKTQMEGKAGVLTSEIQMDKGRGASTEAKEAELADTKDRIDSVTQSQMDAISDVNKKLDEAAKADRETEKTDHKTSDKNNKKKVDQEAGKTDFDSTVDGTGKTSGADVENVQEQETPATVTGENAPSAQVVAHVDVRL